MNHDRSEDRWSTNRIKFIKSLLSDSRKMAKKTKKDFVECCCSSTVFQVELREQHNQIIMIQNLIWLTAHLKQTAATRNYNENLNKQPEIY